MTKLAVPEIGGKLRAPAPQEAVSESPGIAEKAEPSPEVVRPVPGIARGPKSGQKRGPYHKKSKTGARAGGSEIPKPEISSASVLLETIAALHDFLSIIPVFSCMPLDAAEKKIYEKALHNFLKAYPDFSLSPKLSAWIGLVSASSLIYIPRVLLIREELRVQRAKRVKPDAASSAAGP